MGRKSNKFLTLVYNDHTVHLLNVRGNGFEKSIQYSFPLDKGIVVNGIVEEEALFYSVLQRALKQVKSKNQAVRLFVPDSAVMMKTLTHPEELTQLDDIRAYIEAELGETIHLPFENASFDLYDENPTDGEVTMYATDSNELTKVMHILTDLGHYADVADIRSLADLRVLEEIVPEFSMLTTLVIDFGLNDMNLTITSNGEVEFLRYQPLGGDLENWSVVKEENRLVYDYVGELSTYQGELVTAFSEIERIINFYHFSLHKGEKEIEQIYCIGENPMMNDIAMKLQKQVTVPTHVVDDVMLQQKYAAFNLQQIAMVGLAIKEVK